MTTEKLIAIAATVLSLLFSFFPGLRQWYEKKDGVEKRQIMAIWLVIVTAGLFGASCVPAFADMLARFGITLICTMKTVSDLIYILLIAIGVNQGVFWLTPKKKKPEVTQAHQVILPVDE